MLKSQMFVNQRRLTILNDLLKRNWDEENCEVDNFDIAIKNIIIFFDDDVAYFNKN